MNTNKKIYITGTSILGIIAIIIIGSVNASAEPSEATGKLERLWEVRKDIQENSEEYQELSPLAAKSRSECILLDSREGQMKYLNAQNNNLRVEEKQLMHDLKILGIEDPLSRLQ